MKFFSRLVVFVSFFGFFHSVIAQTGSISGSVLDKATKEPLFGASVSIDSLLIGTSVDYDGSFLLSGLNGGTYSVVFSYLGYTSDTINVAVANGQTQRLTVELGEDLVVFNNVEVTGTRRSSTELASLSSIKTNTAVVSVISAQQISRTQDRDASEVIKRVPGISIVDNKFIIVRGLSQRYNNVWINGGGVPSSEADSRSFSFDIIPSSQLDNVMIIKSPMPEYPADFSGGFVNIKTKDIPAINSISVNFGTGLNDQTLRHDMLKARGSSTDFLGFDNGFRGLQIDHLQGNRLDNRNITEVMNATKHGFNNNWNVRTRNAMPDIRLGIVGNRFWETESGRSFGLLAALNYSHSNKSYINMENSRYGIWNVETDQPEFVNDYTDNQYNVDDKVGAMFNLSYAPNRRVQFEFRNIFNQIGRERYTERFGYQFISGKYNQEKSEYFYNSRTSYSSQFSGKINTSKIGQFDWILSYSYANRNQPDRRMINQEEYVGQAGDPNNGRLQTESNDISRDFSTLDENIYSGALNYLKDFQLDLLKLTIKSGLYAEFRDRSYDTRLFYYRWNPNTMPADFSFLDPINGVLSSENFTSDKVYIYEDTDNRNNYKGDNRLLAAYLGTNFEINRWNIYGGVRYENNLMTLTRYLTLNSDRTSSKDYTQSDFFPSINATYRLNAKHQLRAAYGMSINRQEFREVSPSVYYDFELFSDVKGNLELKPAYIQNFDFRYEIYPSEGEMISLALFYKNFKNPIEWTYLDAGGSYTYTFENAESANNFGAELEIRKNLSFLSLPDFLFTFNGAIIDSKVTFGKDRAEEDRPMQGQSPYIVNTGLYYMSDELQMQVGLLYNIIGKRIVGIGRADASEDHSINNTIPDTYEMPRNVLDFTFSKKFGKVAELRIGVRDILAESVRFLQTPAFVDANGKKQEREQTTKEFKPGRTYTIGLNLSF